MNSFYNTYSLSVYLTSIHPYNYHHLLYQTQNDIIRKWNMWEAYARELVMALKGVAPNWDNPSGYCYCSQDAFHDDDGERIEHDGDHELQCVQARKALYRAAKGNSP